jgi:DNA-binding response OmpR family regulator
VPRLLLVEDDAALAGALRLALEALGHTVWTAGSGEDGLVVLADAAVDLAIVDVMLPGMDGFEFCRRVGAAGTVPMLLLTARSDPIDIVVGLECGADDYVTKPVEPRVLDARIKAILRRSEPAVVAGSAGPTAAVGSGDEDGATGRTALGPLVVDELAMRVTRDGEEVKLTATELRLLIELLHHRGQTLTRRTLLERVWEYGYSGDTRLVDACVQRLRSKIETRPSHPELLQTVRGIGYRLERE